MGRSPASQWVLANRLRKAGIAVRLFGYASFRPFARAVDRLVDAVNGTSSDRPLLLIGHSLGCVIIRAALPAIVRPPAACFFLAPPNRACKAAKLAAPNRLYKLLTGEAGQLLASEEFMSRLPVPAMRTWVYAGISGPRGRLSPFGTEQNDGVLALSETLLPSDTAQLVKVKSLHTFIMNSADVAKHIAQSARALQLNSARSELPD